MHTGSEEPVGLAYVWFLMLFPLASRLHMLPVLNDMNAMPGHEKNRMHGFGHEAEYYNRKMQMLTEFPCFFATRRPNLALCTTWVCARSVIPSHSYHLGPATKNQILYIVAHEQALLISLYFLVGSFGCFHLCVLS